MKVHQAISLAACLASLAAVKGLPAAKPTSPPTQPTAVAERRDEPMLTLTTGGTVISITNTVYDPMDENGVTGRLSNQQEEEISRSLEVIASSVSASEVAKSSEATKTTKLEMVADSTSSASYSATPTLNICTDKDAQSAYTSATGELNALCSLYSSRVAAAVAEATST